MHEPHDDPLERELAGLSKYTGEPTSLWREAIDKHRREQHQKLWVWVRRPAPALAAAALALLVASIAVRPIDPTAGERRMAMKLALSDSAAEPNAALVAKPLSPDAALESLAGGGAGRALTRSAATVTVPPPPADQPVDAKRVDLAASRQNAGAAGDHDTAATGLAAAPVTDKAVKGQGEPAVADRSAGNRELATGPTPRTSSAPASGGAPGNTPAPSAAQSPATAPMPPSAAPPAPPAPAVAAKDERDAPAPGDEVAFKYHALSPLDVTANIRLQVPDVGDFYRNVVPSLVDVKNGETFASASLDDENTKNATGGEDAKDGVNLTLRVSENRLAQVIGELRKQSTVVSEVALTPPQAERLKQIDTLVALNETALKQGKVEAKSKLDALRRAKGAAPSDDPAMKKAAENLTELTQRRARVEQGIDFATVNIVAVTELSRAAEPVPPPQAPAMVGAAGAQDEAAPLALLEKGAKESLSPAGKPAPSSVQPASGAETGKITRAAKEGWSSLGDTTADFVRGAIGTMLYWLPVLIAAGGGLWWLRRRAAESMREPPPQ